MADIWSCIHTVGCQWDNHYSSCNCNYGNTGGTSGSDAGCSNYQTPDDCQSHSACLWNYSYGSMGCFQPSGWAYTAEEGATETETRTISTGAIAAIVACSVLLVGLMCALCFVCYRRRKMAKASCVKVEDEEKVEEAEKDGIATGKTGDKMDQEQDVMIDVQITETEH